MATSTTNLGLTLPASNENVSRQIINDNNSIIDNAVGAIPAGKTLQGEIEEVDDKVDGIIDDTAGAGDSDKVWSANKATSELALKAQKSNPVFTGKISKGRKGNTTEGQDSVALGDNVTASGWFSFAEGQDTIAASAYQRASGKYNVMDSNGVYAEIVGNGYAEVDEHTFVIVEHRSNARTLDWDGNECLAGGLTLGKGSADETTITAAQLAQLLALLE